MAVRGLPVPVVVILTKLLPEASESWTTYELDDKLLVVNGTLMVWLAQTGLGVTEPVVMEGGKTEDTLSW